MSDDDFDLDDLDDLVLRGRSAAYRAGWRAHGAGGDIGDNPYDGESEPDARDDWADGYWEAEEAHAETLSDDDWDAADLFGADGVTDDYDVLDWVDDDVLGIG